MDTANSSTLQMALLQIAWLNPRERVDAVHAVTFLELPRLAQFVAFAEDNVAFHKACDERRRAAGYPFKEMEKSSADNLRSKEILLRVLHECLAEREQADSTLELVAAMIGLEPHIADDGGVAVRPF